MRIGVLSDTHGTISEAILTTFSTVDLIIHAGDFTEKSILDMLEGVKQVRSVHGNMDSQILKELLPEKECVTVDNTRIGIIHGWGAPYGIAERVLEKFGGVDIVVFGHSHEPYNQYHGHTLLFNPGKASNSYGMITIEHQIRAEIKPL